MDFFGFIEFINFYYSPRQMFFFLFFFGGSAIFWGLPYFPTVREVWAGFTLGFSVHRPCWQRRLSFPVGSAGCLPPLLLGRGCNNLGPPSLSATGLLSTDISPRTQIDFLRAATLCLDTENLMELLMKLKQRGTKVHTEI